MSRYSTPLSSPVKSNNTPVKNNSASARNSSFLSPQTKQAKSRARREPSGWSLIAHAFLVQQFKEAFSLIDQDGDGIVDEADLKNIFGSLGIVPTQRMLDSLLTARPGGGSNIMPHPADHSSRNPGPKERGINFTMFLTMMGEHLLELDPEAELIEAFECFDDDRMSDDEIERFLKGSFMDRQGNFNYREWVKVLRVNEENEEES
ncbi:myosin regulatory light chain, invertebrate [Rhizoctonia solani]|uniref:Myosin regulatory light chain, invertebrate n=1 Tax=Rhizoctonia solani TaxID=456999 RepID=A0A8H8P4N5_9AGAM|nr:myosin regulatory light chain, invertebrate [Rhizoctonia solani]QRW24573.1 myosin regulatory light chain, invertebrate [Rhizoctonia solani]